MAPEALRSPWFSALPVSSGAFCLNGFPRTTESCGDTDVALLELDTICAFIDTAAFAIAENYLVVSEVDIKMTPSKESRGP